MPKPQEKQQAFYHKLSLMIEDLKADVSILHKNVQELKESLWLLSPAKEEFKTLCKRMEQLVSTEAQGYHGEMQLQAMLSKVSEQLEEVTTQATISLAQLQKTLSLKTFFTWLASMSAVILTAISVSYFYLTRIESITTRQLVKTYKYGLFLKEIWPKLSKQDQERLSRFLEDKDHHF